MKLLIVLFAVVAAASAYPGVIPWAAPVASAHPAPVWKPESWPAPAWQPSPKYVKVAPVAVAKVHSGPAVHQVLHIPQPSIPNLPPQPLTYKIPNNHAVQTPLYQPKITIPHLIGVEAHVPEPVIKVVAPSHHSW